MPGRTAPPLSPPQDPHDLVGRDVFVDGMGMIGRCTALEGRWAIIEDAGGQASAVPAGNCLLLPPPTPPASGRAAA
ncbi:hypothetical protein [Rhodospirillum centenum]|uniref:Uncharacterized protein n=1 Tax=Rhodospirillum centenum (strain ATCC 51521 / SW) TaxID=414684 RepID=B6IVM7_RHOCS|nr:hypothetical protein [Rhodospirillum centenum]ACJ00351.1 hypothetical protein RC1_2983 [Rhodospirillum centenum SW]